ncbi:MAG TPA: hypothetical protein VNZ54_09105, partial [bacterium]|nr:hypothetical protein [bacterium]
MARPVHVVGLGLSCALGRGMGACLQGLRQRLRNTVPVELPGYSEAVRMPYYALAPSTGPGQASE